MYALNDYARPEAIVNLPLTCNMQPSILMSRILGLLPAGHGPCFFLRAAFLKCPPVNVSVYLVHDRTSDPLTLALCADKIFQSLMSSASAVNHFSSAMSWKMSFLFTPSPLKLLVLLPLVAALAILQLLPQPLANSIHPLCVGITDPMLSKLRSVKLPVPVRETSWPAGSYGL